MIQHRRNTVIIAACATLTLGAVLTACGGGDSRTRNAEVTTTLDENGNAPSTTLFDWQAGSSTTLGEGSTDVTDPTQSTEPGTVETTVPGETTTTTAAAEVASSQNVVSPTDASDGDSFGGAVALSADGKTLAVGALYDDVSGNADQGSVTVYGRSGKSWVEEKVLVAENGSAEDWFGYSVAVSADGNTLAIGAVYADVNGNKDEGSVSVFARSGGAWSLQKTLNISGGAAGDLFGYAVALSADGSTLAVGAISDDVNANVDQGSVSVFARTGTAWKEQQVITLDNGAASGNFGWSVSLSTDGNTLAAGGPNQGAGKAAVFTRSGGTWS
jgi:hypothetical protein